MIATHTVFVLGAGANVPYGFSTGAGLVDKIRGKDPRTLMGNAGERTSEAQSKAFRQAVEDNLLPSIDALLEHRADLLVTGKRVMATVLYQQERSAKPESSDTDWMALVFQRMADGAASLEAFSRNAVSFVTFNYDRYLEYRLIRGLVSRYNVAPHDAWRAIGDKVIHLYGSLGDLPEQFAPATREVQYTVPLGAPEADNVYHLGLALPIAESAIKIVHDMDQPPEPFEQALQRIQAAQHVMFLGFGFGRKNVERLQTTAIPDTTLVFCTVFGMTDGELRDAVLPAFPRRNIRGYVWNLPVKQFLREQIDMLR